MNNIKTNLWQVLPTVTVAFVTGYLFNWMLKEHSVTETTLWLGAFGTISAIVCAFILGERQIHMLWRASLASAEQCAIKKRASFRAIVTAALEAMAGLEDHYCNTHQDKMRIRIAYHGDTFVSLIEALSIIPVYELGTSDAAIALAGLKKNMMDAQRDIEALLALANQPVGMDDLPAPVARIDLIQYKACADLHGWKFQQALKK